VTDFPFQPFEGPAHITNRGYLPHWRADGATYFVTYRLDDSLPKAVAERISRESGKRARKEIEDYLDGGHGECLLRNDRIAEIVAGAMQFFDGERYHLHSWCVMPNHAHAILFPNPQHPLSGIVHSWKSFTSTQINKVLSRKGPLWQVETFDHIVRNERQLYNLMRYVAANPRNAGLKDWKWVYPTLDQLDG
jgi:REP element-mobilizing transposase RayT